MSGLRWQVREAETGAQAWAEAATSAPEALIVDSWLPDLAMEEFLKEFSSSFPNVDLVTTDGDAAPDAPRSPYRQELLYALRMSQDSDSAAWTGPGAHASSLPSVAPSVVAPPAQHAEVANVPQPWAPTRPTGH